ncbi:MAG: YbaK/EbsC family protein [Actinobacteria bacterium]|nr:YbaK/EbsC family protein [Actinomycetota bacterium]MBU1944821.1 YbaK/EbsC family protein [Actinomycetota bacterium]MBU2687112.1 YbaK/EbsC family protein [Actinomycetota bacterium]
MFSSIDVHNRLQDLNVPHELFKLAGQAQNLERAAAALGLEASQMARVEVYRVDDGHAVAVVPGDRDVDLEKLRAVTGGESVGRVPDGDVPSLTGFRADTLPPVAHKTEMPTYIDYYTLKEDVVYTGCGEPTAILKIRSYDLVRATGGETVDIVAGLPA